jgi:HSP20 family protein
VAIEAGKAYLKRERPEGEFTRTLALPFRPEAGRVSARYNLGVLRITLPRAEAEKPRQVKIEAA